MPLATPPVMRVTDSDWDEKKWKQLKKTKMAKDHKSTEAYGG